MNRTLIKNFSVWARRTLIGQVAAKAQSVGVTPSGIEEPDASTSDSITLRGTVYGREVKSQRERLVRRLRQMEKASGYEEAYEDLIDEVAYTWFNRFIALRYMEANAYIPRVLSSSTPGSVDPDILRDAVSMVGNGELPGITLQEVERLRASGEREGLYRRLFVAQCNALNTSLPFLFKKIAAETTLLLPANLLHQESVIRRLVNDVPAEDWGDVEIVGWIYQYYISERKDEVFARKSTVPAKDIPAATQVFTPHWIVRYMVENSVGRMWLTAHPESKLRDHMPYYLEPAKQELKVPAKSGLAASQELTPEDLTVMDPACGSGHILVYAFDLLYEIYRERGYLEREIPRLILTNNLHGLDIDERAAQLACFAVMMKARARNRRILRDPPPLNILSIQHTRGIEIPSPEWGQLLEAFRQGDTLGSLIEPPSFDDEKLQNQLQEWIIGGDLRAAQSDQLQHILRQASLLSTRYAAVIANPPYMGSGAFDVKLKSFVDRYYPRSKSDLFAVFLERCLELTPQHGLIATINQHTWMFLSSYEALRTNILVNHTIENMIHLGSHAFPEVGGEVVQSTSFVLSKRLPRGNRSAYVRLTDLKNTSEKERCYLSGRDRYTTRRQEDFAKIPGSPIVYWASDEVFQTFSRLDGLNCIASPVNGVQTSNNDRFLRLWYEVASGSFANNRRRSNSAPANGKRWFPYNKGGQFRKWYGNRDLVVDWENDGRELKRFATEKNRGQHWSRFLRNTDRYFQAGITWSSLTTGLPSFRFTPEGSIFDTKGPMVFGKTESLNLYALLSLLNSKACERFLEMLSPTLDIGSQQVSRIPIAIQYLNDDRPRSYSQEIVSVAQEDWNSSETSWDFRTHLLVRKGKGKLQEAFAEWKEQADRAIQKIKRLEEENNQYWISAYGFEKELSPEVPDKDITLRRADLARDVRSLISYAVGCMMGRYSLDEPGLIHAGQNFDPSRHLTFPADRDAILPITGDAYFEDDAVSRFIEFLRVAFGPEHLTENLDYIADALTRKKNETAVNRIRRYFLDEFVKDHIQTYNKRPIYWLFTSGKHKGFNALVYLHRYDEDTVPRLRTEYLHELQPKLEAELLDARDLLERASTGTARKAAEKRVKALTAQLAEIRDYDEKLRHAADQRIRLDLDDGVAYNYTLFEGLLYEGSDLKMADLKKRSKWKRDLPSIATATEVGR